VVWNSADKVGADRVRRLAVLEILGFLFVCPHYISCIGFELAVHGHLWLDFRMSNNARAG
jgi:hypothetical protein